MTFEDIFEYFDLPNSYNVALLPAFVKRLLEIQRIESLRKNNRTTNEIQISPLGNHAVWEAKRIVLVGFDELEFLPQQPQRITTAEINSEYDHVISLEGDLKLTSGSEEVESYLHTYSDKHKNETKTKKVVAPTGSRAIINKGDRQFTEDFIKQYLKEYQIYFLTS
jgi:hypothetical protein